MSRAKKFWPKQWLPSAELEDAQCTLPQLWSRHHCAIQKLRKLSERTVEEYTTQIGIIQKELSRKPAAVMTCYDLWEAVRSVQDYPRKGHRVLYKNGIFVKRMAAIHDIYLYCESACICCDVLDLPPWQILFPDGAPDYAIETDELSKLLE